METATDTAFCFELSVAIHEGDEAEANRALAKLLDEAEELGFELIWTQPLAGPRVG